MLEGRSMKSSLAIVIVNYNGVDDTLECVDSIKQECILDNEIIIVDNNSNIFNKNKLIENQSLYTLILNKKNQGFSCANNIGIKYAMKKGYENILLINNDTIITKNSIEIMLEKLNSDSNLGIVGCTILYNDYKDLIWFDGGNINWNKFLGEHENMKKKYNHESRSCNVSFLSGCCMLIKSKVFEEVGLLPEEYFMYFEDVDFCAMVLEFGYKLFVCKEAVIYHKVSAASGGEDSPFTIEWCNRNRIVFMKKYKYKSSSKVKYIYSIIYFILGRLIRLGQLVLKGEFKRAKALIKGCLEGIRYIERIGA